MRALARRAPRRPWCSSRISPICRSTECSGLSEVIGSWKIMVMSIAAHLAQVLHRAVEQFLAIEQDLAGRVLAGG